MDERGDARPRRVKSVATGVACVPD